MTRYVGQIGLDFIIGICFRRDNRAPVNLTDNLLHLSVTERGCAEFDYIRIFFFKFYSFCVLEFLIFLYFSHATCVFVITIRVFFFFLFGFSLSFV